ncbi:MAG TPA: hypothetical protein VNY36_03110 [Bacteroidia bacterium]|jgi:hypothetical protein|nr:hypothetical protein [Bacteroidia bacterium]
MLSPIIKKKITGRYRQEVKYPKQCEALASAMNAVCGNKISASTLKRLWGFTKASEGQPRIWTLDIIAEYVGYKSWEELQNDIAGNKVSKNKRIESVDCSLLKPGKRFTVMFGKVAFIKIEYKAKNWFTVLDAHKVALKAGDEVQIEKMQLDFPVLIKKMKRSGTLTTALIIGGVTGITEITDGETEKVNAQKQSNGLLNATKQ